MSRRIGDSNFSANFEVKAPYPLDAREYVNTLSELIDSSTFPYAYKGMKVVIGETDDLYILSDISKKNSIEGWNRVGNIKVLNNSSYFNTKELAEEALLNHNHKVGQPVIAIYTDNADKKAIYAIGTGNGVSQCTIYASKEFVINSIEEAIDALDLSVDLSEYYTISQIEGVLSSYADKDYVDEHVAELVGASTEIIQTIDNLKEAIREAGTDVIGNIINDIATKANSSDVYIKSEIDTKLNEKANNTDVYTKGEVDTKVNLKANSSDVYTKSQVDTELNTLKSTKANISDIYNKGEVDTKVNLKANSTDVYTKSQTYNRTEIEAKIDEYEGNEVQIGGDYPTDHRVEIWYDDNDNSNLFDVVKSIIIDEEIKLPNEDGSIDLGDFKTDIQSSINNANQAASEARAAIVINESNAINEVDRIVTEITHVLNASDIWQTI